MIGELSEKGVHNGLKNYLEPDKSKQEIKVGRYFADIKNDSGIIEIQTKQFFKLKSNFSIFFLLFSNNAKLVKILRKKQTCLIFLPRCILTYQELHHDTMPRPYILYLYCVHY